MIALDTNVLVRYIVQDDKTQAAQATYIIEQLTPEAQGFISSIVLCETNWVLKTTYNITKPLRIDTLQRIFSIAAFDVEHSTLSIKALQRYKKENADFSDFLISEIAKKRGYSTLVTFDKKAGKCEGFTYITPHQSPQ